MDQRPSLERRYRDEATFTTAGWLLRMAGRHARWIRTQGIGRLVEEHELHPARNAASALAKTRWRHSHGVAAGEARAAFLTGVPRSGTNMLARALANLPEVDVLNDGNRRAFRRYRLRDDEVLLLLVRRSRHRLVLFKPLLDAHRIPQLMDLLATPQTATPQTATPETATLPSTPQTARVLWAYRDVDARARSALAKFGPSALVILREVASSEQSTRWQAQGLARESLDVLRSFDWDRLSPADGAALIWLVRNRLYFDLGLDRRPEARLVSYDVLVRDPVVVLRGVCEHLGVEYRSSAVARVDRRSVRPSQRLELTPRVRALCDEMTARLDDASASAAR